MKNHLSRSLVFLLFLLPAVSCKKYIQQQKQNALMELVTNGTWRVSRYQDHQTDISDSFAGYIFQFRSNETVDGVLGSQTTTGTWTADVGTRTIQSNFPNAGDPLKMLNYTWTVTDSYNDSVSAKTLVDSVYNYLELHKN